MGTDEQKSAQQDGNNSALSYPFRTETYTEIKKRYSHDAFCKEKLRDLTKAKEFAKHILKPEDVAMSLTLADQLFAEGEVIGEAKSIIRTLTKRFQIVPPETTEKVLGLTDLVEIERLADFAYDCQTLDEFEIALNR